MSDMQVAVWLWWKARNDLRVPTGAQIIRDHRTDEVGRGLGLSHAAPLAVARCRLAVVEINPNYGRWVSSVGSQLLSTPSQTSNAVGLIAAFVSSQSVVGRTVKT